MTEDSSKSEPRRLKPIIWPKINFSESQLPGDIVFPIQPPLEKSISYELAENEVIGFFSSSIEMAVDALSLHELQGLEIEIPEEIISGNSDSMASFGVDDDGYPHLKLSKKYLSGVIGYVSDLLTGEKSPDEIVKTSGEREEDIEYKTKAGAAIAACIHSLAHELYHARQALQDSEYYANTLNENITSAAMRSMSKEKGDAFERIGFGLYHGSQGERAAGAFGVRFLKEFKKKILSIEDKERSITEKLFLCGVDRMAGDLVADFRERYRKQSSQTSE